MEYSLLLSSDATRQTQKMAHSPQRRYVTNAREALP